MLMNIDICKTMLSSRTFRFALSVSYLIIYLFIFIYLFFWQKPVEFSPVFKHGAEYSFVILGISEIFVLLSLLKYL